MATTSVEKRLLTLEERLSAMEQLLEERIPTPPVMGQSKKGWQAIVGTFTDDPLYEEAVKRGREWRESQTSEDPSSRMLILDTNHINALERRGNEGTPLLERLARVSVVEIFVTIISYEEQVRGWMAQIARSKTAESQVPLYQHLQAQLENYCNLSVLPFDSDTAGIFSELRFRYRRLSTPDLKIAAITIAKEATLLTRNTRDFEQIQGLSLSDWIAPNPSQ